MSNYPHGVSSSTRNAPWNQPETPSCPDCDNVIHDPCDHDKECPCDMDTEELYEYYDELHAPSYDDRL